MKWCDLETNCKQCSECSLSETRHQVVFGTGNQNADILIIGEAPGENEDLSGEPFVGRGGKLLDEVMASVGLSRKENVYISNIVKCRPPKNRDPKPSEQEQCIHWLKEQIEILQPKVIVCLGRIAACSLIRSDYKVTKEHGTFEQRDGVLWMGTFHPAAILRDPRKKEEWIQDFRVLSEKVRNG